MSTARSSRPLAALVALVALLAGVLSALCLFAAPASAAPADCPPVDVGGLTLRYLPAPLDTATDFTYDFDDVDFVSREWESHRPEGGWRVDLDVTVMHGDRLTSASALYRWFVAYEERDPRPAYTPIRVHGQPGFITDDQAFWLVHRGVAVSIQLDGSRWTEQSVERTAAASDTSGL